MIQTISFANKLIFQSTICEDVVGIIQDVDPMVDYVNDNNEAKKQKKFSLTDGRFAVQFLGLAFITSFAMYELLMH